MRIKSCSEMEGEGDGMKTGDMDRGNMIACQPTLKGYSRFMVMKLK